MSGDADVDSDEDSGALAGKYWYVNAYAVSVGLVSTTWTRSVSKLLPLGFWPLKKTAAEEVLIFSAIVPIIMESYEKIYYGFLYFCGAALLSAENTGISFSAGASYTDYFSRVMLDASAASASPLWAQMKTGTVYERNKAAGFSLMPACIIFIQC